MSKYINYEEYKNKLLETQNEEQRYITERYLPIQKENPQWQGFNHGINTALKHLENIKSSIVCCKDCIHHQIEIDEEDNTAWHSCLCSFYEDIHEDLYDPDFFCKEGKQ